jgi:FixJ family two-component response regulator
MGDTAMEAQPTVYIVDDDPPTVDIMITAYGDVRTAVEAMKGGAVDFFRKPFGAEELLRSIRKAIKADEASRQRRSTLAKGQRKGAR